MIGSRQGPSRPLVAMSDHYAEAVFSERGRCWRFVIKPGEGQPMHCPAPVTHKGRFKLRGGRWVAVWSCEGHLFGVIEPLPLPAAIGPGVPSWSPEG